MYFIYLFITKVVTVVAILQTNFNDVIYIPLIAIYAGVITRLTVLLVAYYKYVNHVIPEEVHDAEVSGSISCC